MTQTLRLILGDQLSLRLSSLKDIDPARDIVLMAELWDETQYVKHHKKKIALIFSAMRHFAAELAAQGFTVDYIRLDDAGNSGSFRSEVERAVARHRPRELVVTAPGEYRVLADMEGWQDALGLPVEIREDTRFLASLGGFRAWAEGQKQLRMENFYRAMRRHHAILMDGDKPEGGQWNFDHDNRKPASKIKDVPAIERFTPDAVTREVIALVGARFADHFGTLEPFDFAVTRDQALRVLRHFIATRLPGFGDHQDMMITGQPVLYHAHISFYLNCGLLHPLETVQAAEAAYRAGRAPLAAVEGFIRQILGWREYMRGVYWLKMPGYDRENALRATRKLPWFYWSGETAMNCLHQCVEETKANAYAHHIQRLMVLGNFALLAGLHPDEVNEWYMIVYADAYQWVELPNVTGMILFADGGFLGSKPYAAGGAYINRMSDYCKGCRYDVKQKTGPDACPFNYLYWDFLDRHRDSLRGNIRLAMPYKTLERMDAAHLEAVRASARAFLEALE
jgi:deoxyribodipyrimidine photolyase-related protein